MTFRALVLAIFATAGATNAMAQRTGDELNFAHTPAGNQPSVVSHGKTILIGQPSDASLQGRLIDLDGDKVLDAAIKEFWDDGTSLTLWLRRGDSFVSAGSLEAIMPDTSVTDFDKDGFIEVMSPPPVASSLFQVLADGEVQVLRFNGKKFVPVRIACEPALRSAYLAAATEAQGAANPDSGKRVVYGEEIDRLELGYRNNAIARFRGELRAGCPAR